jgi:hypothetical protein
MRPKDDPYYKAQLKAIELEYMLDSPTVTNMPNRSIETRNDDPKPLPDIMSFGQCMEFATNPANELEEIIEGCLHEGCKMIISGSSKAGKTWSLINLAIAASNGMPWLGMPVKQSKVLYLDFELKKYFGTDRIKRVAKAMFKGEIPSNHYLDYWPLRGHRTELLDLLTKIRVEKRNYELIILDPYYKLATGIDENDAKAVGEIVNLIEDFSEETGAAIVFAHHFSKGNKSETDHIDRASGSGVFARDPDAILTLTSHEEEEHLILETTSRNCPFSPPKVLEFSAETFPLFEHKPDLEAKFRKPGQISTQQKKINEALSEKFLTLLKDKPIIGKSKVIELLEQQTNNKITDAMWASIYNLSKSKIDVEKNGPGNQNIYSLKLQLKSE